MCGFPSAILTYHSHSRTNTHDEPQERISEPPPKERSRKKGGRICERVRREETRTWPGASDVDCERLAASGKGLSLSHAREKVDGKFLANHSLISLRRRREERAPIYYLVESFSSFSEGIGGG